MSTMPWFRVYSEILDDRKLKRIAKKTGQSKALVIGMWICLLSLANKSIDRGKLIISEDLPYSIDDLEDETGLPREIIAQLLDEFRIMGMVTGNITIEITNWGKRQYKSDDVSRRVRRFREKQKEKEQDETLQERFSNVIDTEEDTDTESEEMQIHPYAALSVAFVNETQIPELTGGPVDWFDALERMGKAGVEPDDIITAVRTLREKKYSIVRLSSIVNAAISEMSKRKAGEKQGISKSELARLGYDHRGS